MHFSFLCTSVMSEIYTSDKVYLNMICFPGHTVLIKALHSKRVSQLSVSIFHELDIEFTIQNPL